MCLTINYSCSDVVRAYRGVLKEKEALEASIQALSVGQNVVEDERTEFAAVAETKICNEEKKQGLSDENNAQQQTDDEVEYM